MNQLDLFIKCQRHRCQRWESVRSFVKATCTHIRRHTNKFSREIRSFRMIYYLFTISPFSRFQNFKMIINHFAFVGLLFSSLFSNNFLLFCFCFRCCCCCCCLFCRFSIFKHGISIKICCTCERKLCTTSDMCVWETHCSARRSDRTKQNSKFSAVRNWKFVHKNQPTLTVINNRNSQSVHHRLHSIIEHSGSQRKQNIFLCVSDHSYSQPQFAQIYLLWHA